MYTIKKIDDLKKNINNINLKNLNIFKIFKTKLFKVKITREIIISSNKQFKHLKNT